ncbi:molybdenum ABC transporter ATP-binding protein [Varunaivibrio sulfuroxidans]|uniref:Molybdate transport system ATP-binding protein n=1 Tax=Varunaivibrio sulfuroxidans TaxID=1773489 RepID=A0A4R3JH34_9PROT|nr:molybdenum ABC transporter ATP-binding protein [Varunaivibrio sulfuroxidans]TCS64090.1 molybdate transport system ATP-binding protein [Varunaivibrio sulfuroxidans]WES31460.1 molybdenum ABC transporter ATP-binding protein [Varunaivibrio sulfuroxidans]
MLNVDIESRQGDFTLNAQFSIPQGITAVFGRSGAGKTTLINILSGLSRPDRGRIVLGERVVFDSASRVYLPPERRDIGYVFQDARLFPHLNVRHNLTYGISRLSKNARGGSFDKIVALLDIETLLARMPARLSGGERQRVAIGRALLSNPKVLLMDEPLAALDGARKNEILPFIERLHGETGIPIVYVSHAIEEVIRLADTLILLSDGRVRASGPLEDIMNRLDLHPLTGRYEAGAVLSARVGETHRSFKLTQLLFPGGALSVPELAVAEGTAIRTRIRARDVALALTPPKDTSILNIFRGKIIEIRESENAQVDVLLDIGAPLIARISRKSAHGLQIETGKTVYAMIKAIAIDRGSLSGIGATVHRDA